MKSFVLFDTEFTAWKNSKKNNWSGVNQHREIIEIAAYKIKNFEIIDTLHIYVLPTINQYLSNYTTKLTGITNDILTKKGISFNKAIEKLYTFSKYYKLYSYGNDWDVINENIKINKLEVRKLKKWKQKFFDFKTFIKTNTDINPEKYSSGTIYKAFKIKANIKQHNAMDDVKSMYLAYKKIKET